MANKEAMTLVCDEENEGVLHHRRQIDLVCYLGVLFAGDLL